MSLRKLKNQRSAHRQDVSKRLGIINEMLENLSENLLSKLENARSALITKRDACWELDKKILDSLPEDTPEELMTQEIMGASEFTDTITFALLRIDKALESNEQFPDRRSSENGGNTSSIQSGTSSSGVRVRLPKLELQKFDGDPKLYQTFWDTYESVIHKNEALSDIDRFNYLRAQLIGAAASAIAGLPCTSENYNVAVDILKERFGKKSVIISSHMDALMKLQIVTNGSDSHALRRVYDKVETHIRSLQALGIKSENYGALLVPVILSRLPEETKLILSRKFDGSGDVWELEQLLSALKQEIEARERTHFVTAGGKGYGNYAQRPMEKPTAAVLLTQSVQNKNNCCFCQGKHSSISCKIVSNIDARKSSLLKSGRCFVCLKLGHLAKSCRSHPCDQCGMRHNVALCNGNKREAAEGNNKREIAVQKRENNLTEDLRGTSNTLLVDVATSVLLQTAVVLASAPRFPDVEKAVRLILDPGSQRSYVTQDLFKYLRLPCVGRERLQVNAFGGSSSVVESCPIAQLRVRGRFGGQEIFIMVCVVPNICTPPGNQQINFAKSNFKHLAGLKLADDGLGSYGEGGEIDILVGSDFYWAFALDGTRRGKSGPVAINTKLGWVLSGPIGKKCSQPETQDSIESLSMNCFHSSESQNELASVLSKFWSLESLGIDTNEEEKPLHKFSESLRFDGQRYEVSLPFRENHNLLADNYKHSSDRLQSLLRKLGSNEELLRQYDAVMQEQLQNGVLEEVEGEHPASGKVYYMPHLAVVRKDKETTKLRVVYDASSRVAGPSLNECLYEGPSLLPEIFNVLLNFRLFPIGITADIEKAFLQISVREQDRDFQRVLWVDDVNAKEPKEVALRFTRCVFGVASSPFHLNATLLHHMGKFEQNETKTVETLKRSLYVDDVTAGVDSTEEGFSFFQKSLSIMKKGGFNLRKWATNSDDLACLLGVEKTPSIALGNDLQTFASYSTQNSQLVEGNQEQKVLGVLWNRNSDVLSFKFDALLALAKNTKWTKRELLSIIARSYDPLGIISPLFTPLKVAFQQICMRGGNWDDFVTEEVAEQVHRWLKQLEEVQVVSVPRYCLTFSKNEIKRYDLIGFSDASCEAYGGSVYIRTESAEGVHTHLLAAKTKVAPLKKLSVPRLELLGMLILARLMLSCEKTVSRVVPVNRTSLFSDSMTALYWVKSDTKRYKQWVERRVDTIRGLTTPNNWMHIKGDENPADLQSRGINATELKTSKVWFHGPGWLKEPGWLNEPGSVWPDKIVIEETAASMEELKASERQCESSACLAHNEQGTSLLDYDRFSSFGKIIRVMAYVLKFVRCLRNRKSNQIMSIDLTSEELNEAETAIIKDAQAHLRACKNFESLRRQLVLYQDEKGLIRSKGRIDNSEITETEKYPIVLQKDHKISELIVIDSHNRVAHRGVGDTMAAVRSRYWIPCLRQLAKRLIHRCYACRRFEGLPYNSRPFPPLPSFRAQLHEPFRAVGTDYAGPLYLRQPTGVDEKGYVLLFTCAASRAVHLELVSDLSAHAFVRALRRFISRRGAPHLIISDNAKTFHSAETKQFLLDRRISWKFNVPSAPWTGGFFESMIKTTKRCLRKVLISAKLNFDEMHTALTEIEGVINNRPITYIDNEDTLQALTPNHLIFGRRLSFTAGNDSICDNAISMSHDSLNKRVMYRQKVVRDFNKRWTKEYLLGLRQAHKGKSTNDTRMIKVGDVVLVYEDGPRLFWRLGRVEELLPSKDDHVRSAKVVLGSSAGSSGRTIIRAVSRLYPLETMAAENVECRGDSVEVLGESLNSTPSRKNGEPLHGPTESLFNRWEPGQEPVYGDCNFLKCIDGSRTRRLSQGAEEVCEIAEASKRAYGKGSRRRAAQDADFKRILLHQK